MLVLDPAPSTHENQIGVAVESEEIHQQVVVVSQVESTEQAQAQTDQAQTHDEEEE